MDQATEINFDGLVGPTHNYSGLAYGNLPSMQNAQIVSNPKKAALEGLAKMRTLMSLGIKQGVLPPQDRPFIPLLRALGFEGSDDGILVQAAKENPALLTSCGSASSMWAANAATVSPSADSKDKLLHFTPANLTTQFHRSFEAQATAHFLRRIFDNPNFFAHHFLLPPHPSFSDEGAANHTRFCKTYGSPGVQLFVYGKQINGTNTLSPQKFPGRQSDQASKALARLHRLTPEQTVFALQNPEAIDAGVFHNDVISVGNQNVFFFHEKAFADSERVIDEINEKVRQQCETDMVFIKVLNSQVPLHEAVKSYLFNSQLVTAADGSMILIAPQECKDSPIVNQYLNDLANQQGYPIKRILYQNVRESMQNGGGPACLRLRVVLNEREQKAMSPFVLLTESLYQNLVEWVNKHYRDRLTPQDLADPKLLHESRKALDELSWLLQLGNIYPFQNYANAHRS